MAQVIAAAGGGGGVTAVMNNHSVCGHKASGVKQQVVICIVDILVSGRAIGVK